MNSEEFQTKENNEDVIDKGIGKEKILSAIFNKSKTGNTSIRIGIPSLWAKKLLISETNKKVKASLDDNKIIIEKYNIKTEEDFKGNAILCIREKEYPVQLHFKKEDKNGYTLYAKSAKSIISPNIPLTNQDMNSPILKNIYLEDSKGNVFETEIFRNVFIISTREENTEFKIKSRIGYFKLVSQKESEYNNIYYDNFTMRTSLGFQYKNTVIRNLSMIGKDSTIQIYDKTNLSENNLNEIILVLELLQGQRIIKILERKKGKELIIYGVTSNKLSAACNPILSCYYYSNEFSKGLLEFLEKQTQVEKEKWKRAIKLLSFYKASQNLEFLVRLFQFINIFKDSTKKKEKYKDIITKQFNVQSEDEACFITKTRNDIIHEGLFLHECINKNIKHLKNSESILKEYFEKKIEKAPFIYAFYIEKLVTNFIERKIFSKEAGFEFTDSLFLSSKNNVFKDFDYILSQLIELN
ncbi:MAG: hypothetical protein ACRC0Y_13945 [Fusobacteriaceae bacterium]